jgi:rhomboid family protein
LFPIRDLTPRRVFPVVTLALIAVNALVFFAWEPVDNAGAQAEFLYKRAAIACELTTGHPLTIGEYTSDTCTSQGLGPELFPAKVLLVSIVVSLFLHANLLHLAGNMWFLWIFGDNVEGAFGRLWYLLVYLAAGVIATIGFVVANPSSTEPLIGASGAIAGVLGSYLVLYPRNLVVSLVVFYVVPVPAVVFLGIWFAGQFLTGEPGVAWQAHVAGFAFGAALTFAFRAALLRRAGGRVASF